MEKYGLAENVLADIHATFRFSWDGDVVTRTLTGNIMVLGEGSFDIDCHVKVGEIEVAEK